ncbi:MAG: NAD-dependent epimerase/dehydratase family protein [Bacteroidota bacterium]
MILVTGGTGLIGSHLLYQLCLQDKPVKATYRTKASLEKCRQLFELYSKEARILFNKIQWVKADIIDIEALQVHFDDVTEVYHSAALISFDPRDFSELMKTNQEGTANMVNLSVRNKVKKFCYVSSIAALGQGKPNTPLDEETEWNPQHATVYGISKFEAELEVWRGTQEGLKVVVVNPGIVLGPGFWHSGSGLLFKLVAKQKTALLPSGTGFTSVNEVVDSMLQLMDSSIVNERYILVNQNLSYTAFLKKAAEYLGVAPPKKRLSTRLLDILWRLDWMNANLFGKPRKLTKNMVRGMQYPTEYDAKKSLEIPGFAYRNLEDEIKSCCEFYRQAHP